MPEAVARSMKATSVGDFMEAAAPLGVKYLVFSPLVPLKREKNVFVLLSYFCLVCIFFEGSVFTFKFLNDKIHNYVKKNIIVNFIIQKLKSKHTSLKKYTN